jgi:superfamily II RNA helicase
VFLHTHTHTHIHTHTPTHTRTHARTRTHAQAQRLTLVDDLKRMKRVLRRLGHTDEDNVIQLKGQTASQISTADELLVTELMFNGVFGVSIPILQHE